MAGRLGFHGSSPAKQMIVVSAPAQELAFTNLAYYSAYNLRRFSSPGSALALVGDSIILSLRAHDGVSDGHIALNAIQ